jgi:hypothetical protein
MRSFEEHLVHLAGIFGGTEFVPTGVARVIYEMLRFEESSKSQEPIPESQELSPDKLRDVFLSVPDWTETISSQNQFLRKKDRHPLCALVSAGCLEKVLNLLKIKNVPVTLQRIELEGKPLFFALGIPFYYSPKLSKATILIVGEASWAP